MDSPEVTYKVTLTKEAASRDPRESPKTASDTKIPFRGRGRRQLPDAVEGDFVAHRFELVECPVLGAFGVESGEEVRAGVLVEGAVAAHVPDRDEHRVLDRDVGFHRPASCGDPAVAGAEVGALVL